MKKKRLILVAIIIILFSGLRLYLINKEKPKMRINSGYEHQLKVNDFTKKQKGKEPDYEINTNEGGYENVLIANKQSLTTVIGLDTMFNIDDKITQSVKYINKIISSEVKSKEIEEFYYTNSEDIKISLGIGDLESFTVLVEKLNFAGNETIYKATIDDKYVSKINDDVRFNLILQTLNEKEQLFNINFKLNDSSMYWN
ncbi:hypothetical protein HYH38_16330 [Clostridium botulinum]|uniref:Uncharacterized protein n=1 Tax=Clostridium botulinum TaxID=1491 RepID=A0A126JIQ7_CLOBO|nr:hypothetical protein [Clostridium botulinum]ALT05415.1 hypothetical protein [Clostridium botulinum]ALT05513.1 hypothetical protein [Clostridium botulinum]ALT05611.1 hypothetical protein [Clostridium botulinum]ALT05711.1 hypothetical protein [Clostridium botulinum]ALT05813.1 hypothetical protein [Clostridium botulinum]